MKDFLHAGIFVFIISNQLSNKYFLSYTWKIYIYFDVAQMLVYFGWSLIEFKILMLFTKPTSFRFSKEHILWLRFFIISNGITLIYLLLSMLFVDKIIATPHWSSLFARLVGITHFIFINTIVYVALKIPDIFISIKYKNSKLPDSIQRKYLSLLTNYMETDKPHLNPLLSIYDLANHLAISPKHLSQVINNGFGKNFYQYINTHRIQESKKMLLEKKGPKNILDVAYQSGFNSKNTFNTAFKKDTGMTPSEFIKQQK